MKKRKRKYIKPRRRRLKTKHLFVARAKGSESENTICEKARAWKVEVSTKGHARHRLYFECSEEKWSKFYSEIKGLCFLEPSVKCPRRVRKRILANFRKTANYKFSPARERSVQLLERISSEVQAEEPKTDREQVSASVPASDSKPPDLTKVTWLSSIRKFASRVTKLAGHTVAWAKRNWWLRLVHNR